MVSEADLADDIAEEIMSHVERELPNKIGEEMELPSEVDLRTRRMKERRKKKASKRSKEEIIENEKMVRFLRAIKEYHMNFNMQFPYMMAPFDVPPYSHDEYSDVPSAEMEYDNRTSIVTFQKEENLNISSNWDLWQNIDTFSDSDESGIKKDRPLTSIIDKMRDNLPEDKINYIGIVPDDNYDRSILIEFDSSAREAFEMILSFIDDIDLREYNAHLLIDWLGEDDLDDEEFSDYLVEFMIKSHTPPRITGDFDAVEEVKKERE